MQRFNLSISLRLIVVITLVLFVCGCEMLTPPNTPDPRPEPTEPLPDPQSCSFSNSEFELTEASVIELELSCLIINHEEQQRPEMHYHPILGEIARMRAEDMALNGYYGEGREYPPHVDNEGYGPNHYLCLAEYRGDWYCRDDPFANSVESIAAGYRTPERVLEVWYNSEDHRIHILGEIPFFADANHYGIGHAVGYPQGSEYPTNMWVFIAALPPDMPDTEY